MDKIRFAIVGSGWRSLFYVRLSQIFPQDFELLGMLCRTEEKALSISREYSIRTFLDEKELFSLKPDFVVSAVNKTSMAEVTLHLLSSGQTVVCETPAALNEEDLDSLWTAHLNGGRLFVAEQYPFFPDMKALIENLDENIIGQRYSLYISRAHEYHAFSLMRAFLDIDSSEQFSIRASSATFPIVRTKDRYKTYTDGSFKDVVRTNAEIVFDNGKTCLYDFEGEQYHSSIRGYSIRVGGDRGEYRDGKFTYLDSENKASEKPLVPYECSINEDEWAISCLLKKIGGLLKFNRASEEEKNMLSSALQDAYSAILLRKAVESPEILHSQKKRWNKNA